MTKKIKQRTVEKSTGNGQDQLHPSKPGSPNGLDRTPWISMKTGVKIITVVSILMAALTAWQAVPLKGWTEGILSGVAFGGAIWVIFFGIIFINRFLRGNP